MAYPRWTLGWFGCALGLATALAAAPPAPTTRPAAAAQPTNFSLSILEIVGPKQELEQSSAEELVKRSGEKRHAPGATFAGQMDLSVPAHLAVGARVPVPSGQANRRSIAYIELGTTLIVTGSWEQTLAKLHLNLAGAGFGVPGVTSRPDQAMNSVTLDRDFSIEAGRPLAFKFEDQPQQVADTDQWRIHVGTLSVKRAAVQDAGTRPDQGTTEILPQPTLLEFEVFTVSAPRARLDAADLNQLVAGTPSSSEIMTRLGTLGSAERAAQFRNGLDVAGPQKLTCGSRIPMVQNLTISSTGKVTPSIAYQEIGTELTTKASQWDRSGAQWICDLDLKLSASAMGESGVEMGNDLQLPTFVHVQLDGRRRFQSGRPEYFLFCSEPGQGEKAKATVWIARMILTRPE